MDDIIKQFEPIISFIKNMQSVGQIIPDNNSVKWLNENCEKLIELISKLAMELKRIDWISGI